MDVFISHSSQQATIATQVEKVLQNSGVDVWLDQSKIRLGVLLRNELQNAIKKSHVLILLWSKDAATSRWIAAEILTAFHLNRFILPCVCDDTLLPYFLRNDVFLNLQGPKSRWTKQVCRAVEQAPKGANAVPPFVASQSVELRQAVSTLNLRQHELFDYLRKGDFKDAAATQKLLQKDLTTARQAWPCDSTIKNLAGYHYKNAYMLKYDAQIQAGQPPKDRLLVKAERFFFDSLFVNPNDYSSLNGLGSILIYERDYEAAEFFVRKAIALAEQHGLNYAEAKHDLALIQSILRRS